MKESASSNWILRTLACGGCVVVALWGFALLLGGLMGPLRILGQSKGCQSNLHSLTRGFQMYADDYEDHYPISISWIDSTGPYVSDTSRFHCPSVSFENGSPFGYAANSEKSAAERGKIAELSKVPLIFDSSVLSKNANDSFQSLPKPGRHTSRPARGEAILPGNNIGYGDGSVRMRFDPK